MISAGKNGLRVTLVTKVDLGAGTHMARLPLRGCPIWSIASIFVAFYDRV